MPRPQRVKVTRRARPSTRIRHDSIRQTDLMRRQLLALLWEESCVQGDSLFGGERTRIYQDDIAELRKDSWNPFVERLPPDAAAFLTDYHYLITLKDEGVFTPPITAPATVPDFTRGRLEPIKVEPELPAYLEALRTFTTEVAGLKCEADEKPLPPLWALETVHQQVAGTYDPDRPTDEPPLDLDLWWLAPPAQAFATAAIAIEIRAGKAHITLRGAASTGNSIDQAKEPLANPAAPASPGAITDAQSTIVFSQWERLEEDAFDIVKSELIPFLRGEIQRATHVRNARSDAERKRWEALPWLAHWLYSGEFPGPSEEECEGLTDDQIDEFFSGPAIKRCKDVTRELAREVLGIIPPTT
jgi:hypothetical protein